MFHIFRRCYILIIHSFFHCQRSRRIRTNCCCTGLFKALTQVGFL